MLKQLKASIFLALIFLASSATQSSAGFIKQWNGSAYAYGSYYPCSMRFMSRTGLGNSLILMGRTSDSLPDAVCTWSEAEDSVDADWDTTERLAHLYEDTSMAGYSVEYNAVSNNGVFLVRDDRYGYVGGRICCYSADSSRLKKTDGTSVALPVLDFTVSVPDGYEVVKSEEGNDISADGNAVAGTSWSYVPVLGDCGDRSDYEPYPCLPAVEDVEIHSQAFRWAQANGTQGLGYLPGGSSDPGSSANSISADGTVVAGWSSSTDGVQAFRWTETTGMVGLGDLPGGAFESRAKDVSSDGATVVGYSSSESGTEAFRWTQAGGMVGSVTCPGVRSSV